MVNIEEFIASVVKCAAQELDKPRHWGTHRSLSVFSGHILCLQPKKEIWLQEKECV